MYFFLLSSRNSSFFLISHFPFLINYFLFLINCFPYYFEQNLQAQREKAEQAPPSPKEIIAEEDSGMESLRPPRPAMPMSFLDELKAKKNKSSTGVTPPALNLSFLDQIKAKKQQNNDDNAGNLQISEHNTVDVLPTTPPTPPDLSINQPSFLDEIKAKKNKMMPPMGGMSFLEQIKARKQALD